MRAHALPFLAALAMAAIGPAFAQSTGEPAPAEDGVQPGDGISLGEPVQDDGGIGAPYVREEFGDWDLRCVRTEGGNDPCQLYQLLEDQGGNAVAEISVFPLPENQQAEAGATIVTPLETLLTEQLTLTVDSGQAKRYPFTFCTQIGCIARIGLLPEEVDQFRRGASAIIRIVPAAAADQQVTLDVSLSGFTAGFNAVQESNEAATEN